MKPLTQIRRPMPRLLGHHDLDELLVVNLAVTVNVSLADHLIDLLVGELLAKVGHDVAELSRRDEAVAILVEDTERLLELLLGRVLAERAHDGAKLLGGDGAIAVLVEEGEGLLELSDLLLGKLLVTHVCLLL